MVYVKVTIGSSHGMGRGLCRGAAGNPRVPRLLPGQKRLQESPAKQHRTEAAGISESSTSQFIVVQILFRVLL